MQTLTQTDTTQIDPATKAQLPTLTHTRNPGMELDLDWVARVQANTSAIERRAATLGGRRHLERRRPVPDSEFLPLPARWHLYEYPSSQGPILPPLRFDGADLTLSS